MKSYVVLFVAISMLVKPLWPVVEYVANYNYIKTVLCVNKDRPEFHCDGKCYLAKLLAEEQEQRDRNPFGEHRSNIEFQHVVYCQALLDYSLEPVVYSSQDPFFAMDQLLISSLFVFEYPQPPEYILS